MALLERAARDGWVPGSARIAERRTPHAGLPVLLGEGAVMCGTMSAHADLGVEGRMFLTPMYELGEHLSVAEQRRATDLVVDL